MTAGGALGAAYSVWHISLNKVRTIVLPDAMKGCYLGPEFSDDHIHALSKKYNDLQCLKLSKKELLSKTASLLNENKIIGWFQGRMEFGPRALGNRSILADPRAPEMQRKINSAIKFRESFRPFAPSVMEEQASKYFTAPDKSPYMLKVSPVNPGRLIDTMDGPLRNETNLSERLAEIRSDIPSVTHVDGTARVHTVSKETNPFFLELNRYVQEENGL